MCISILIMIASGMASGAMRNHLMIRYEKSLLGIDEYSIGYHIKESLGEFSIEEIAWDRKGDRTVDSWQTTIEKDGQREGIHLLEGMGIDGSPDRCEVYLGALPYITSFRMFVTGEYLDGVEMTLQNLVSTGEWVAFTDYNGDGLIDVKSRMTLDGVQSTRLLMDWEYVEAYYDEVAAGFVLLEGDHKDQIARFDTVDWIIED